MENEISEKQFTADSFMGKTFSGFSAGQEWNGWQCPFFTFEEGQRILAAQNTLSPGSSYYNEAKDAFIFNFQDEIEEYLGEMINGQKLYPIGNGIWIWEEANSWNLKVIVVDAGNKIGRIVIMSCMADIIQYAKFYNGLSELEKELNETANIGIHLQIDASLTDKLIEAADAIQKHIKSQADVEIFKKQ